MVKYKKENQFLKIFTKIIMLMVLEDMTWFLIGRFTQIKIQFIIPLLLILAVGFSKWIAHQNNSSFKGG